MALFKIFRGTAASFLNSSSDVYKNAVDGYCYFVNDTGKFYIDIGTGSPEIYRKALNAECADRFYDDKTITFTGDMTG